MKVPEVATVDRVVRTERYGVYSMVSYDADVRCSKQGYDGRRGE